MDIEVRYDAEVDALTIDLAAPISDGTIARDVGPQLTPNRQWIHLGYDDVGNLRSVEVLGASVVVHPSVLAGTAVSLVVDEDTDEARLILGEDEPGGGLMAVGPQLTPSRDGITMLYGEDDRLVAISFDGQSRVLPHGAL